MSKGLEALKKLTEYLTGDYNDNVYEWLSEIEEELKEKERLKTSYLENLLNEESKKYIYKKLKAFEIIEDKGLNTSELWLIKANKSWEEYCEIILEIYSNDEDMETNIKTKEEYELLQEVML